MAVGYKIYLHTNTDQPVYMHVYNMHKYLYIYAYMFMYKHIYMCIGFMRSAALELASNGVTVNSILPGNIVTGIKIQICISSSLSSS
jgi:hypothetical protein